MGKVETTKILSKPTIGELIDRMDELRAERKLLDAESKKLKEEYDEIALQVIELLEKANSSGQKTKRASVSINETEVPVMKDIDAFVKWVVRTKNTHLFTASCVSAPSWREILELNPKHNPPPGTEVFTKKTLNHTSLKGA